VRLETGAGTIVIELFTGSAPVAAENFANLAQAGFYNGVVFHRIIPGFMIQGGDPTGTGGGGPGYSFPDEPFAGQYTRGMVAMANAGPDTNGSQFFILVADYALARNYTIFGRVTSGMDVVDKIVAGPRGGARNDQALEPVSITGAVVQRP
jgi:cyclophilin family peptidyl-prolyl cis-trans isomerase